MTFKLKGGSVIRSIPQLKRALAKMTPEVFTHHVNHTKNDFSSWVKDIYGDVMLADALRKHTDKPLIEKELERALREAFLQHKPRK